MKLFVMMLLFILDVIVSAIPRPVEYGSGIFRNQFGGQGRGSFRNFGNRRYNYWDRQWNSPYKGVNNYVYRSLGNTYGGGISNGNWANNYRDYGPVGNINGRGNSGGSMVYNSGGFGTVGDVYQRRISSGNSADIYDDHSPVDNVYGSRGDSPYGYGFLTDKITLKCIFQILLDGNSDDLGVNGVGK